MTLRIRRLIDSVETEGALRVVLLDGPLLAIEHLGDGDLLLLPLSAGRALADHLQNPPSSGAGALPDGSLLRALGDELQIAQGTTCLTFLRREARDLAAAIAEMDSLAGDLAAA
jgi:hypothetical protein